MSLKDLYLPGRACWAECSTDLAHAIPFYSELFGWDFETSKSSSALTIARLGASAVAGFRGGSDTRSRWTLSFNVLDASAMHTRVTEVGGTSLEAPIEFPGMGLLTVFADPSSAPFSMWESAGFAGFEEVNVPGTFCWAELVATSVVDARHFYSHVFSWGVDEGTHDVMDYTLFRIEGKTVAGAMTAPTALQSELSDYWGVYYMIRDLDASLETVAQLGGRVALQPTEIPEGRFAVCVDPGGALFHLLSPKEH